MAKAGVDHELSATLGTCIGHEWYRTRKRNLSHGFDYGRRPPKLPLRILNNISHTVGFLISATQADSQSSALSKAFSTQRLAASVHPTISGFRAIITRRLR
jgi:hypothetical protein